MTVIINDFEIMVEPPTSTSDTQPDGQQQQEPMPQVMFRPQDIERVIRHFEERRDRLIAD